MPYCLNRRGLIMTSGILLFTCLILYGIFGAVHSSIIRTHPIDIRGENRHGDSQKELQLVHVVFRHGPRTPADTYPNDPYINETFDPHGWGQLTNAGKVWLYDLGQWLRHRYGDFLGNVYVPDMVHAQTTGVSRTLMSMSLVLASLWPPKNTINEWNKNLNWQPIPVFSEPLENDTLLLVRTSCPRYYEALDRVFTMPEVKAVLDEYEPIYEELTNITGLKIASPDDVQSLYSTLRAEEEFGLKLPPWTEAYYPEKLQRLTELSYIYNVYTDELKSIKGGPFVRKMIGEWTAKRDNKLKPKDRKIYLYSGHDSTVVNILAALNVWEQQIPVYGIMGIFELYKDLSTNEYEVQIHLRNNTKTEPYHLTIPGCESSCPLDKVLKLTKSIISSDQSKACRADNPNFTEPPPSGP